jgi:DNA polymerase V
MLSCDERANVGGELEFISPIYSEGKTIPLFFDSVQAGFPSPAEDYIEERLDPFKYLVTNPVSTFFVRAQGVSMLNSGICSGDLLVVDRSIDPKDGDIVVCAVNGLFTVKRLNLLAGGKVRLVAANPTYPAIILQGGDELKVFGVVTFTIKKLHK